MFQMYLSQVMAQFDMNLVLFSSLMDLGQAQGQVLVSDLNGGAQWGRLILVVNQLAYLIH